MVHELARKRVKLRRTGGSQSATFPKDWLRKMGIADQVDLVLTDEAIVIVPANDTGHSIEDEPEFPAFLRFLARQSLAHPEILGDVGELMAEDDELFEGVVPD
ncbi:MAG: AbrB/MazE/SpoVT family DNA-binding domain-containing protein [Chloroflexota bacterium]